MADDTLITSLNFNHGLAGKSIMDKKNGVQILFGYVSGLSEDLEELLTQTRGLGIALQDSGIGQGDLDRQCQKLAGDCRNEDLKLLITKSDMPFDRRWFIIGDIRGLIDAASKDKIKLPVSDFLYDNVLEDMGL